MIAGEDEYKKVLEEIDELKSMIPDGFFSYEKPDWKSIWGQIRIVGASFKGVKFPTRDEHQKAWDRFQRIVSSVKEAQAEEHKQWEEKKSKSSGYKDEIIYQAELAKPSGPMGDLILSIATGGLSTALSALMGPFDERKDELVSCSDHLKQGWALLNEYKENMLGQDKKEAYNALYQAKEQLDQAWADYKRERQQAFDDYQNERQRNIEANIDKLEDIRENLLERIAHREEILDNLQNKLDEAWSDDYRDNISGWIDEEEKKIDDLRSKLDNVENWLEEARNKLNS